MPSYDFEKWFIARKFEEICWLISFYWYRGEETFSILEGLGTDRRNGDKLARVVSFERLLFERGCQEVVRVDGYEEARGQSHPRKLLGRH